MRAKFLKNAAGDWKGIALSPYCEFDVPERLQEAVAANANFEVLTEEKPKRGRPRKVQDGDAA